MPGGLNPSEPLTFAGFESEESIAFYVESSGTTGRPKLIARLYRNARHTIERLRPKGASKAYSAFPPLSSAGLGVRVGTFLEGGTVVVRDPVFGELLADGVELVQASPAQTERICEGAPTGGGRIKRLLVWGAQMPPRLVRHWLDYFDEVELGYGSREASRVGRMTVRVPADADRIEYRIDDEAVVEIVDEGGSLLPRETMGIVRIRTITLANGYVGDADATKSAFREGWFYPGDLGSLSKDGKLRIHGRIGDELNFGGIKVSAADIDDVASQVSGVSRAVCFARPNANGVDELHIAATLVPMTQPEIAAAAIRQACETALGPALLLKSVHFPPSLPLSDTGKEVRAAIRAACEALPSY
jgi:acyl-CoA synthetase (AMP-forming)/AMP-acid ligase II